MEGWVLATLNKRSNHLKPEEKHGDQPGQAEPLKRITVMFVDPQIHGGPLTQQTLPGPTGLPEGHGQQGQARICGHLRESES